MVGRPSVVRLTEAFRLYLRLSITETPVMPRMSNAHPYDNDLFLK